MSLTQEQVERFEETGWLVLPGALPADLLEELRREAGMAVAGARGPGGFGRALRPGGQPPARRRRGSGG